MTKPRPRAQRPDPGATLGPEAGPTFGEMLAQQGLVEKVSGATRQIIDLTVGAVTADARVHLTVISCFTCTAPKACCALVTMAYLYEVVPIAARLLREGRDTPELRERLRLAAHRMETAGKAHQKPCVFLGADERCTIYEDRPSLCGTHLVTSPPGDCGGGTGSVEALLGPIQREVPPQLEEQFRIDAGLRRIDRLYLGALPRMVLLCLEAWPRRDYVTFLAERGLAAAHRYAHALR